MNKKRTRPTTHYGKTEVFQRQKGKALKFSETISRKVGHKTTLLPSNSISIYLLKRNIYPQKECYSQ